MPTPNAAGLRSRKVDFKKPLLVFRLEDIPVKDQSAVLSRNIPIFATGVEKEEEEVCLLLCCSTYTYGRARPLIALTCGFT